MPIRWNPREHVAMAAYVGKWLLIAIPVGAVVGSAVALFLWALDLATRARWATEVGSHHIPWLLYLLPIAGMAIGLMYHHFGKSVEAGNNLIIDQIHEPGGGVPARMAPLVLIGTVVTHLFGGSAGREGTAVQMGGSIASTVAHYLRLDRQSTRTLLMAGIAAGFGAVFGTPLAGAIFAIEVLAIGSMSFASIVPCLIASIAGDWTVSAWRIKHTHYSIHSLTTASAGLDWLLLGKVVIASIAFGLASVLFAELTHGLHAVFKSLAKSIDQSKGVTDPSADATATRSIARRWLNAIPGAAWCPAIGGVIVIVLALLISPDYLGLGVTAPAGRSGIVTIVSCFTPEGATYWSWWWKILFTAVTLAAGFKGGEVTPLFFIGAALGHTMARLLGVPQVDLFAGLGFVAVFAGATNTPLACTIMGIELFTAGQADMIHSGLVVYLATACFLSYLFSGHSGVYLSQRITTPKLFGTKLKPGASLRSIRR